MRNRNKIFYAKTEISATGRRDMWLISSPTREEVEKIFLLFEPKATILSMFEVQGVVETDSGTAGRTYIKVAKEA